MSTIINELFLFLQDFVSKHPGCKKEILAKATAAHFQLTKKGRSVYTGNTFSIRFSTANKPSFSNQVLGLSTLRKYDHLPFIVCIVRSSGVELLLANSTFLKKISHSSHLLRIDKVRGSFLGHDILREYEGMKNAPANFSTLFSIHSEFTWKENLARLVEATNNISPIGVRFEPTPAERSMILSAVALSASMSRHAEYTALGARLTKITKNKKDDILEAAKIETGIERGNAIEQLITQGTNIHKLEDLKFVLTVGTTVFVDIKTKLLALSSNPKGYNIDKVLIALAQGNTTFSFFFLGIDLQNRLLSTRLVSILDRTILSATRIQSHWAGRNSRGVTQLSGELSSLFSPHFREFVDVSPAKAFLQRLIEWKKPQ